MLVTLWIDNFYLYADLGASLKILNHCHTVPNYTCTSMYVSFTQTTRLESILIQVSGNRLELPISIRNDFDVLIESQYIVC